MNHALVLLSGGFDSTAALAWALCVQSELPGVKFDTVRTITFLYGQQNQAAEDCAAGRAARELCVDWERAVLADSLGGGGLLDQIVDHQEVHGRPNPAFVPGRNLLFLSSALSYACRYWPSGVINLVIGCCKEDADGFPDCRMPFLAAAQDTMTLAVDRRVRVWAPWVNVHKRHIWSHASLDSDVFGATDVRQLLGRSWSCYRSSTTPCGTCTACVLRLASSTDVAGACYEPMAARVHGGDVHRELRR